MGMYTGLRAKLSIKEEFWPVIEELMKFDAAESEWGRVAEMFPQYPFLAEWAGAGRCDFIPFGALCYMPWEDTDPEWQRSFKDGLWVFQCSVKNYEDEIEFFVETVLPHIVEACYELYSLYEENEEPTDLYIPGYEHAH